MATQEDFNVVRGKDSFYSGSAGRTLSGMTVDLDVRHRFGGTSGIILKSTNSGNITFTNAASGKFTATIAAVDTSGLPFGAYAFQACNVLSGNNAVLTEGFMILLPNVGNY